MPGLVKVLNFDGLNGFSDYLPVGKYRGLQLVVTGTNKSGQTADLSSIGRFELLRNGETKINRTPVEFGKMNNFRGGSYTLNSADGGDFEAVVNIPFEAPGMPNVLDIQSKNELQLSFISAEATTELSALKVVVKANYDASLIERYNYIIVGADQTFSAAKSADPVPLDRKNIVALLIDDVNDTITGLAFNSNGQQVVSTSTFLSLVGATNLNNLVESTSQDWAKIENYTPGIAATIFNRNSELIFTTNGAGSVDITVCAIEPTKNFSV